VFRNARNPAGWLRMHCPPPLTVPPYTSVILYTLDTWQNEKAPPPGEEWRGP